MTSKKCCLRQHIRNQPTGATNPTFLDLSLDDKVLKYHILCPNLLDSHIQEDFKLLDVDVNTHETGSQASQAILCWIESFYIAWLKQANVCLQTLKMASLFFKPFHKTYP